MVNYNISNTDDIVEPPSAFICSDSLSHNWFI